MFLLEKKKQNWTKKSTKDNESRFIADSSLSVVHPPKIFLFNW